MPKQEFTLETFAKMLKQQHKLGFLRDTMKRLPGMGGMANALKDVEIDNDVRQLLGLIDSMTPAERREPSKLIGSSRRDRIATGAGVKPHEVKEFVRQFDAMSALMKEIYRGEF